MSLWHRQILTELWQRNAGSDTGVNGSQGCWCCECHVSASASVSYLGAQTNKSKSSSKSILNGSLWIGADTHTTIYRNHLNIYGLLTQRIIEDHSHDIIFSNKPDDVSSIDVMFPVCDHQLEIKGEEQVQVLKSSTIKCLWLLMHTIITSFLNCRSLLAVQATSHFCQCCHISASLSSWACWWLQGNSSKLSSNYRKQKPVIRAVWPCVCTVLYSALYCTGSAYSRLPTPVVLLLFLPSVASWHSTC